MTLEPARCRLIERRASRRRVWEAIILGSKTAHKEHSASTFIVGDVHGQYLSLLRLLQNTGFLDGLRWAGQDKHLWFVGDLFDRGPDGLAVANLVMRLEREARQTGGQVGAILGNHEVMLLSAYHFGGLERGAGQPGLGGGFFRRWQEAGGKPDDLVDLRPDHIHWLTHLPAMTLLESHLILHADTISYARYGSSITEVNATIRAVLQGRDIRAWSELIEHLNERDAFLSEAGPARAEQLLQRFGGQRIVHGHTPISLVTNARATRAFSYADGLCINIDGGFSSLEPGFVHRLEATLERPTASETV